MVKYFKYSTLIIVFIALICSCSKNEATKKPITETIVIGASSVPHAEILEFIKPKLLEQENIALKIVIFNDYILPNLALVEKNLDANFFQHIPYLKNVLKDNPNWKLVSIGPVHMHPYRFYSKKYRSLQELPNNAKVMSSNNISQHGHILKLYQDEGLIKLRSDIDPDDATIHDIVENPRNLQFLFKYDAPLMPQIYKSGEADVASIDNHFAINAGLDLSNDIIYREPATNLKFANVVVVRKEDETLAKFKILMRYLTAAETKQFINQKYKGQTVAVE